METCILVIGGSDSSAGAGIQADIKTAAALGVHAASAVTCITAQNTRRFGAVQLVEPSVIEAQVAAVAEDFSLAAVKVGMLGSPEAALAVERALRSLREQNPALPVVLDPVLAATTQGEAPREVIARAICRRLLPMATLVTPNLPESKQLAQCCQQILSGATTADNSVANPPRLASDAVLAAWAARSMVAAGAQAVLVKGGHASEGEASEENGAAVEGTASAAAPQVQDLLFGPAASLQLSESSATIPGGEDGVPAVRFHVRPGDRDAHMSRPIGYSSPRVDGEFHGTGCVLSTAIACALAQGKTLPAAVAQAHGYLHGLLQNASSLGRGSKILAP